MIKIVKRENEIEVKGGNYAIIGESVYVMHNTVGGRFLLINISTGKRYTEEKTESDLKGYLENRNAETITNKNANLTFEH